MSGVFKVLVLVLRFQEMRTPVGLDPTTIDNPETTVNLSKHLRVLGVKVITIEERRVMFVGWFVGPGPCVAITLIQAATIIAADGDTMPVIAPNTTSPT